ncbi:MAG TPA: APC family permease [Bryobacteraceae bacterium]|nr:APC family permease [Bryobacteraceae bacterium]
MALLDLLFGPPLATEDEKAERIGAVKGIPIFGLDALSSVAYGPEAALTLLIPLGMAGVAYIVPISISIIILLTIVYFSYRQTIMAYPQGGGSYTVANENLGVWPGLLAASSLMVDYVLTAAVGISAGVGALVSAAPSMQKYTLPLCLVILAALTLINLRGVRETGGVFLFPTYLFIICILAAIAIGLARTLLAGGHPLPVVEPPKLKSATMAVSAWLLLRAFSSGCTAMTGVEAVSNGVMAFREPASKNARAALTIIVGILILMLAGLAFLVRAYGIAATPPGEAGYESVLSQLIGAAAGKGVFYWVSIGSILVVLSLSANTAFADFPRLSRAIARNGFLPHALALRGRRLVFEKGIYALAILAGGLLIFFGGITDRLIPLYAVGAFLAFTLSQAGMVMHWKRVGGPHARKSMFVNGLGATATAITVLVVLVAKFTEGAWITLLLIPGLILLMHSVNRHYGRVALEIETDAPVSGKDLRPALVVLPIDKWNIVSENAIRFAWTISPDVQALHIECGEETDNLCRRWGELVETPAKQAGLPAPELVLLKSPFRFVVAPIVDYVLTLSKDNPNRQIAVLVPELVESHWYYNLLHNNRPEILKALLLFKGNQRIVLITIPWHLED